jgi:hypothetical protein
VVPGQGEPWLPIRKLLMLPKVTNQPDNCWRRPSSALREVCWRD